MENKPKLSRRRLITVIVVAVVALAGLWWGTLGNSGPVNPNNDKLLEGGQGTEYAALYNFAGLYTVIEENDEVLRNIQEDILLFARTTRPELKDTKALVGFTFNDGENKEGDTSVYTGKFYGVKDDIQIKITPHGRGVNTLSITNLADGTNIDESLGMNGQRNRHIQALPIEKDYYSIRYQLVEDRIVVSFYDGYTNRDIDEVVASITTGMGDNAENEVVFSLNRVGIVSLDKIRENLVRPLPRP